MIAFPILAAAVSLAFGVHLLVRFLRRGALHEGLWAIAMLMFAGASGALALGIQDGWSAGEFQTYWLLGAVLTVPYLAQGELYLLARDRRWIAHMGLAVLLVGTALMVGEIRSASMDPDVLRREFPLGREVFGDGSSAHRLAQYASFPAYFFLLGGATYAAGRMRGRQELRDRFLGTTLIAIGATVVAIGSGIGAGLGNFALFSTTLAGGAAVMYWGFLLATRRGRAPAPQP